MLNPKTENLSPSQKETLAKLTLKLLELRLDVTFELLREGPVVTAYGFAPQGATRVAQLEAVGSDLAVALGVEDVLVKRMPGDSAVSVCVPNAQRKGVAFRDVVGRKNANAQRVPLLFGVDQFGSLFVEDLTELPHLLIAGSTGSGKSTLLASMLGNIVYSMPASAVRLLLSDTKGVEFTPFIGAPHLSEKPLTSVYQTLEAMDWLINETESRLRRLAQTSVRNIHEYNINADALRAERMPYVVLVIDELADIMTHRGEKRGESKLASDKLSKIVQKARASGIYVVAATQRPSVDVVAGIIKANFPARLTFRLPSVADSRTVLGTSGAEHLLSQGDCLYASPRQAGLRRLHAPLASQGDIRAACEAATLQEIADRERTTK